MDRVFVLLKRKPGMSFEDFRTHYESSHAKLGEKYFGHLFATYRRNYIPQGRCFEDGSVGDNAYDCLTELVFREPGGYDELRRIASDPDVHRTLIEDEAKFLDRKICANAPAEPIVSDCSKFHAA